MSKLQEVQMTNQASEDELRGRIIAIFADSIGDIVDDTDDIIALIRTEKLKLLDRLESKAFYDPSGTSPLINPREIQAERNKLEAEL